LSKEKAEIKSHKFNFFKRSLNLFQKLLERELREKRISKIKHQLNDDVFKAKNEIKLGKITS